MVPSSSFLLLVRIVVHQDGAAASSNALVREPSASMHPNFDFDAHQAHDEISEEESDLLHRGLEDGNEGTDDEEHEDALDTDEQDDTEDDIHTGTEADDVTEDDAGHENSADQSRQQRPRVTPFLPYSCPATTSFMLKMDDTDLDHPTSAKYDDHEGRSESPYTEGLLDRSILFSGTGSEIRRVLTRAAKSSLFATQRAKEGLEASEQKYEDEEPFRILVLGGSGKCRKRSTSAKKPSSSGPSKPHADGSEAQQHARMRLAKRGVEVVQLPVQAPAVHKAAVAPARKKGRKSSRRKKPSREAKPRRRGQPVTRLINASKSATGSSFYAYCLDQELTVRRKNVEWHKGPDLVIIEVGINDVWPLDETATRDFERLLRTLREMASNPAIIVLEAASLLLAQTTPFTSNAEYLHLPAAQFFDVPVLSVKSALFGSVPALRTDSNLKMEDLFLPDLHHPNQLGHDVLADVLVNYLEREACAVQESITNTAARRLHREGLEAGEIDVIADIGRRREERVLPIPYRSLFTPFNGDKMQPYKLSEPTCLQIGHDHSDVRPLSNTGWTKYAWARDKQYLVAEKPGAQVTYAINVGQGKSILVDYLRSRFYNLGDVLVYLDGDKTKSKTLTGYWDLGWSIGVPALVFDEVDPGRHTVTFELLGASASSHPLHKTKFRLIGLIST
ncbi:hypothetical protein OIO90_002231 [Microbotryomycetes sp. JL221]|nr:hypothetical protein OIO90_002231 [Microbotryomycetes sp. JL221]